MRTQAEIEREIKELESKLSTLRNELDGMQFDKRWNRAKQYKDAKARSKVRGNHLAEILNENDIVWVTGSRSQSKIRKIVKKNSYSFMGEHLDKNLRVQYKVTDHGYDKVIKVYVDGTWYKADDYLKMKGIDYGE